MKVLITKYPHVSYAVTGGVCVATAALIGRTLRGGDYLWWEWLLLATLFAMIYDAFIKFHFRKRVQGSADSDQ